MHGSQNTKWHNCYCAPLLGTAGCKCFMCMVPAAGPSKVVSSFPRARFKCCCAPVQKGKLPLLCAFVQRSKRPLLIYGRGSCSVLCVSLIQIFLQKQSQYAPTKDTYLSFSSSLVSDAIMVNLALHSTVNFLFGWLVWGGVGGSGGQSGCWFKELVSKSRRSSRQQKKAS